MHDISFPSRINALHYTHKYIADCMIIYVPVSRLYLMPSITHTYLVG